MSALSKNKDLPARFKPFGPVGRAPAAVSRVVKYECAKGFQTEAIEAARASPVVAIEHGIDARVIQSDYR